MKKEVTIYSTQTCKYCHLVEAMFKEKNVEYTKIDVGVDAVKRNEMIAKSGQMGVPVIDFGGEIVVGFDEERLAELIAA